MAGPNPTQKQIAEKYKGNLDYFHKGHYYRRARGICFLLTAIASVGVVFTWSYWGKEELFSTGPISANHAKFERQCQACHEGADPDLVKLFPFKKAGTISLEKMKTAAGTVQLPSLETLKLSAEKMRANADQAHFAALLQQGLEYASISNMDRACLKCHEALDLHQPQAAEMRLRAVSSEFALVHAGGCSTCHREHVGREPMKLPGSEACAICHNDADALARTRILLKTNSERVPKTAENREIGDGIIRFIAPPKPSGQLATFKSYAEGHPPFEYEQPNLRDSSTIRFNHWRHEQADVKTGTGRSLNCSDCHKPGANGILMQPVSYDAHCRACHSLNLMPDYPEITIPHGRADHVTDFLDPSTLTRKLGDVIVARGATDQAFLQRQVTLEFEKLAARLRADGDPAVVLQRRVFVTGDPPIEPGTERITPRSNKGQFFSGCAKCHKVDYAPPPATPVVALTNIPERWVHRGPFTHLPHQHMNCTECHGAAHESKLTSDILMPPQKLCAECHRPLAPGVRERDGFVVQYAELKANTPELAAAQRRDGGVRDDCQLCHSFHAPPSSLQVLRTKTK
jgi:predicted CXXCH cytochrome family protein